MSWAAIKQHDISIKNVNSEFNRHPRPKLGGVVKKMRFYFA